MKRMLLFLVLAMSILVFPAIKGQQIYAKDNLSEFDDKELTYYYTGEEISVTQLDDFYKDKGTVFYNMGENGTWTTKIPKVRDVGSETLCYYVEGDANHNDLGEPNNPESITIRVEVDKSNWGTQFEDTGCKYYLSDDGTASAEVKKESVIWLKEDSYGTSAWYGLDNTMNVFEPGSRFWVRWLDPIDDKEEYDQYYNRLDAFHSQNSEIDNHWLFLTGVTKPDGKTEYVDLGFGVPFYVQLGADWDQGDVTAVRIIDGRDEIVSLLYDTAENLDKQFENINFPEAGCYYARLLVKGFYPYSLYDLDWGASKTVNETKYQVSPSGIVSTIVQSDSLIWVKDDFYGRFAWFALDNTDNTFQPGSRFWVRLIGEGDEEYQTALNHLDNKQKDLLKNKKVLFFLTAGVRVADGKEYLSLSDKVHLYIPPVVKQSGVGSSGFCTMDDETVQLMTGLKQVNTPDQAGQADFYDLTAQELSLLLEDTLPLAFYYMDIPEEVDQKDETKGKDAGGEGEKKEKASAGDTEKKEKNSSDGKQAGKAESVKARLASGLQAQWRGGKLTFKWGSLAEAKRFDVYAAYCGARTFKKVKSTKDNKITLSKINGKALNKARNIKLYVIAKNGKKKLGTSPSVHVAGPDSEYTNVKLIKLPYKSCTIKAGKTKKIKVKVLLKDKKKKFFLSGHVPGLRYCSGNKKFVSVNSRGVIKAKGPGKCHVYVFGQNGMTRRIMVTVR